MSTLTRISWFNRIFLALWVGGAAVCIAVGQLRSGLFILAMLALFLPVSIYRATRGKGSDASRLNAAQPYDERERTAMTWALSIVGMVALCIESVVFLAAAARAQQDLFSLARFLVLFLVWGVANSIAVRRG